MQGKVESVISGDVQSAQSIVDGKGQVENRPPLDRVAASGQREKRVERPGADGGIFHYGKFIVKNKRTIKRGMIRHDRGQRNNHGYYHHGNGMRPGR
jgi:hypothetical protein